MGSCRTDFESPVEIIQKPSFSIRSSFLANEVEFIESIQYHGKIFTSQLQLISSLSNPIAAFYIAFPIGYYLAPGIGLSVLWTGVLTNTLGSLLKLLLQENRPYWWVKKNHIHVPNVTLAQYPQTCSVLPGDPSVHCFVSAAVWWIILSMISKWMSLCEKRILMCLYCVFMTMVCCSRLFLSSNFPHQVIIGTLLGVIVARFAKGYRLYNVAPIKYVYASLVVVLIALFCDNILPFVGLSVRWTYCDADMYCNDRHWIPFKSTLVMVPIVENVGMLIGCGVSLLITTALNSSQCIEIKDNKCKRMTATSFALMLIAIVQHTIYFDASQGSHLVLYYIFTFFRILFIPVIVILLVPRLLKLYKFSENVE